MHKLESNIRFLDLSTPIKCIEYVSNYSANHSPSRNTHAYPIKFYGV